MHKRIELFFTSHEALPPFPPRNPQTGFPKIYLSMFNFPTYGNGDRIPSIVEKTLERPIT